jgi:hypothetical protein
VRRVNLINFTGMRAGKNEEGKDATEDFISHFQSRFLLAVPSL